MKLKFRLLGAGSTTFHSNKLNRDFQRARLMGLVCDAVGNELPCTADLGFDGSLGQLPPNGSEVLLDVTDVSSRNALLELTFTSIEPLPSKK